MNVKSKSQKIRLALSTAAVGGMVAGTFAVLATGPASADPVNLTLKYTCGFPLLGEETVVAKIKSDVPKTIAVNTATPKIVVDVVSTQTAKTYSALNIAGVASLEGSARADATVLAPQGDVAVGVPVKLDKTALPASETPIPFDMHGSGTAPSLKFSKAGHAKINVGALMLNITPRDSEGAEVTLDDPDYDIHKVACKIQPGQNATLAEFDITDGTGSQTTPETTPQTTPQTTPETTPQTTPETTPATTPQTTPPGDGGIKYGYTIKGSTFVKAPNGTAPLTGTVDANLDALTGNFTADLALQPTKGDFKILGFLPVQADIVLDFQGKTTGTLKSNTLTTNSKVITKLPQFRVFGIIPIGGGENCKTTTPSDIKLASEPGGFPALKGGTIKGTYDLSEIKDCNLLTPILSVFTQGKGNTIDLTLTPKPKS
ncbi:DUF6801 domain-containing protein [Actinomadura macrotermitis]|uniref:DUF6801 domain-containing protein n=1 Tax=Actinomadura macrotermitis TaxID=2585200 RepID=A0A7K0BVS2_9ACTN|nr:DUF6801 domain-containing protein [Actinomadura macrotermitis]MQY04784.1 hypothetical protein [Actinomadura macrotermitis]